MTEQVLNRSGGRDRSFELNDLVTVHHKLQLGPRKTAKLSRTKDGLYEVAGLPDGKNPTTYSLKLVGGTGKVVKGHPDSVQICHDIADDDTDYTDAETSDDSDSDDDDQDHTADTDYKIEAILGERGNVKKVTKSCLCRFVGYEAPEWTNVTDMYGCDKLIRAWQRTQDGTLTEEDQQHLRRSKRLA